MRDGYHITKELTPEQREALDKFWPSWVEDAACADPNVDPDIFFPENTSQEKAIISHHGGFSATERQAKAVCARCPVRRNCLDHCLAAPKQPGIWGGTTQRERAAAVKGGTTELLHDQITTQALVLGLVKEAS